MSLLALLAAVLLQTPDGREFADPSVRFTVASETAADGTIAERCRLESVREPAEPLKLRIVASVSMTGTALSNFDGRVSGPLTEGVRRNPLMNKTNWTDGYIMFGALWDAERGLALGVGADGEDSFVELTTEAEGVTARETVAVNAALLRQGSVYECVFHTIPFSPKYAEREALAKYWALYPRRFRRRTDTDPAVYGSAGGYSSWNDNDPESCRFMHAGWEWCHPSDMPEHWGDLLNEVQLGKHRDRAARHTRCGVLDCYYLMGLSNIANRFAERFPDSLEAGDPVYANSYPESTYAWPFPECSWGQELMRQLQEVSGRVDIGAFAFDVSSPGGIYRGVRLREMKNVGWDEHGPGVARAIADGKLCDFVATLPALKGGRKLASVVNTLPGPLNDVLHADTVMIEQPPWQQARPYPQVFRYACGEKGVTFWEGYDPLAFDPGFAKWPQADKDALIRDLSRLAVHQELYWGVSLPGHFRCEYVSKIAEAFAELNDAGWQPVPAARTDAEAEVARYGRGLDSRFVVNNLSRKSRPVELRVFPKELGAEEGLLLVSRFGGEAENRLGTSDARHGVPRPLENAARTQDGVPRPLGESSQTVKRPMAGLMSEVFEIVGTAKGTGSLTCSWEGDFSAIRLRLRSSDFSGEVSLKKVFGTYLFWGQSPNPVFKISPEMQILVEYRNSVSGADSISAWGQSPSRIEFANDGTSCEIAAAIVEFYRKAAKIKLIAQENAELHSGTVVFVGRDCPPEVVSGDSPRELALKVRRYLNAINDRYYPDYRPGVKMLQEECGYYPFLRR